MTSTPGLSSTIPGTPISLLSPFSADPPTKSELNAQRELAIRLVDKDELEKNGKLDPSLQKLFDRSNIDVAAAPQLLEEVGSIRQSLRSSEGRRAERINGATDRVYGALQNTWNEQAVAELPLASRLLSGVLGGSGGGTGIPVNWKEERARFDLPIEPAATTKTVEGCAQILLDSKNVGYWSDLSTGSDRTSLEQLAKDGTADVPFTGGETTPQLPMMQALVDMARQGPIQINALTGGEHSVGSNHYIGHAVDLDIGVGDPAQIESIANAHGGTRNSEADHIHLDF